MDNFDEKLQKLLNNPEALAQVAKLAEGLGHTGSADSARSHAPESRPADEPGPKAGGLQELMSGLDPRMLGGIMELASEFNRKDDRRTALLAALRPYVRPERQAKMDRAAQLVGLARVIRRGLGLLGGG